jgi:hypothetical protein
MRTSRTPTLAVAARTLRHDHHSPVLDQHATPHHDTVITSRPPGHAGPIAPRTTSPAHPLAEDLNVYCEREQLPHEEGTFMTAEKCMALHQVAGMVLLCEECVPVGSLRLGE